MLSVLCFLIDYANLVIPDEMFDIPIYAHAFPTMTSHVDDHVVTHNVPLNKV